MLLHKSEFCLCPSHRLVPVLQRFHQSRRGVLDDIAYLIPVLIQHLRTPYCLIQFQRLLVVEVRQARQRHRVEYFLVHYLFTVYGLQFTDDYLACGILVSIA